ncbi:hypothetical protein K443DRAFT_14044 [Laccaria amethystina LaAM-08-1]|uniref:Uncharacterized protein n=1 Tax=Laccaria amethystina LaAM-08-1 TaxID=1095629 RepID=A0A0C9X5R6_9AGAR|nr:hypothetical protein K443DRAFT_14044 [Laccaria amethystina LaAM-08-1]
MATSDEGGQRRTTTNNHRRRHAPLLNKVPPRHPETGHVTPAQQEHHCTPRNTPARHPRHEDTPRATRTPHATRTPPRGEDAPVR